MGSNNRIPYHLRHTLPEPGIRHPDPFAPALRPPHDSFPPFDRLPPPEVLEQKLAAQHVDIQKLATENQRFAATHGTLRHELAAAQHELQMLRAHMGAMESEREQEIRRLMDRITRMEADLQASESLKMDLEQARADAKELLSERQQLVSKAQDLGQDLQKAHTDMQQFPRLISELENLRQEYQHCRATYDYEKKLYRDHLESLQVMEKNYMTMAREVEKLRAELNNAANIDRRTGVPYGVHTGYNDSDATGHYPVGLNPYENYGAHQGHGPLPGGSGGGAPVPSPAAVPVPVPAPTAAGGGTPHAGDNSETAARPSYERPRGPIHDPQRGPGGLGYDAQRGMGGTGYDAQRGFGGPGYNAQGGFGGPGYDAQGGPSVHGYDAQRGPGGPVYDAHRGAGYDMRRGPAYDAQRGSSYDAHRGNGYDGQRRPG